MSKMNYGKVIGGMYHSLLNDPDGAETMFGFAFMKGKYVLNPKFPHEKKAIAEALIVWMGANKKSALYDMMEEQLSEKNNFNRSLFLKARNDHADHVTASLEPLLDKSENVFVRAVCRFLLLPNEVVRRWLWHANVDFQSCESFLRRMKGDQHASLKEHYDLWKKGTPTKDLPCFSEGLLNKVWRLFNITAKPEGRMKTKAAFAHDFLGMGMGFRLYPDAVDDRQAPKELTSQFLSTEDRGSFEVNKEEGGLYWFLYRTLRSNTLYRSNKDVELGAWVCPGFWFTMFFWGLFLFVSPLSLAAGAYLLAAKGIASFTLFGFGAIFPIIFALSWAKKLGGKVYTRNYWKGVWASILVAVMVDMLYVIVTSVMNFWAFPVAIICAIFLVPYCIEKDTTAFWKAPIIGKVLPLTFLGFVAEDIYRHSNFFEGCWAVLQWIGHALWAVVLAFIDSLYLILEAVGLVGGYAIFLAAIFYGGKWALRKIDTMVDKGDKLTRIFDRGLVVFLVIGFAASLYFSSFVIQEFLHLENSKWKYLVIAMFAVPFLSVLVAKFLFARVGPLVIDRLFLYGYVELPQKFYDSLHKAVSANPFWEDVVHAQRRGIYLKHILGRTAGSTTQCFSWVVALAREVKDEEGLKNMRAFVSSPLYRNLSIDPAPNLLELILSGASEEVILREIEIEMGRQHESRLEKTFNWAKVVDTGFDALEWVFDALVAAFKFFLWPLKMLWKGIIDLYNLWEAFNEQCPQSPPKDRPVAQ